MKKMLSGLLLLALVSACRNGEAIPETGSDDYEPVTFPAQYAHIDTLVGKIAAGKELRTDYLLHFGVIQDSHDVGKTAYVDSAFNVNDSIQFSLLRVADKPGVCSYFYGCTINFKKGIVVSSRFLYPDCDVDFSQDSYDTYQYDFLSQRKLRIKKTITFQKKDRSSENEEDNIERTEKIASYLIISGNGDLELKNK